METSNSKVSLYLVAGENQIEAVVKVVNPDAGRGERGAKGKGEKAVIIVQTLKMGNFCLRTRSHGRQREAFGVVS